MLQRRQTILIVVGVLVVLFVVFQFIPWGNLVPAFARTNPPVERQIQWDSAQTEQLMRTACDDCHSN
ncbi:MAG: cytochrome C, partial [Anaerolineae bacterium]